MNYILRRTNNNVHHALHITPLNNVEELQSLLASLWPSLPHLTAALLQGLYIPWKVTGMMTSTAARAISVRSLASRMRRKAGRWPSPGFTTMLRSTPEGTVTGKGLFHTRWPDELLLVWPAGTLHVKTNALHIPQIQYDPLKPLSQFRSDSLGIACPKGWDWHMP